MNSKEAEVRHSYYLSEKELAVLCHLLNREIDNRMQMGGHGGTYYEGPLIAMRDKLGENLGDHVAGEEWSLHALLRSWKL